MWRRTRVKPIFCRVWCHDVILWVHRHINILVRHYFIVLGWWGLDAVHVAASAIGMINDWRWWCCELLWQFLSVTLFWDIGHSCWTNVEHIFETAAFLPRQQGSKVEGLFSKICCKTICERNVAKHQSYVICISFRSSYAYLSRFIYTIVNNVGYIIEHMIPFYNYIMLINRPWYLW
jgi:hypothetical protein